MSLPEPFLDDLRFQKDILDLARRRVVQHCPEWTDYNLSDPGITLLELQAWMTEMIAYRHNQVPEKNYVRFLNLLGEDLKPAEAACTNLTFYLAAPFPLRPGDPKGSQTSIPAGTAVASVRTDESPELIFTTDYRCLVRSPIIKHVMRDGDPTMRYWPDEQRDPEKGELTDKCVVFGETPKPGNAFYIGFDADEPDYGVAGYVVRLHVGCTEAGGAGVRKENPPWHWQCWGQIGDREGWQDIELGSLPDERDTTGGLNYDEGSLVLYLPTTAIASDKAQGVVYGRKAYWVKCSVRLTSQGEDNMYRVSPTLTHLQAEVIGVTVPATNTQTIKDEYLGKSNGEDGQRFLLQQAQTGSPILPLRDAGKNAAKTSETNGLDAFDVSDVWSQFGKQHEFAEQIYEIWRDAQGNVIDEFTQTWHCVADFAHSDPYSRHFTLDRLTGEVCFGPTIVQPDGAACQFGRVPPPGCELYMAEYRYGGGRAGNLPPGKLQELRTTVSYVDRVTNLRAAVGGTDRENLPHALMRLRKTMWARRAVSGSDFEQIAGVVPGVARTRFVPPTDSIVGGDGRGFVDMRIVPQVMAMDDNRIPLVSLQLGLLSKAVYDHLNRYRLLTATLSVQTPTYVAVKVTARVRKTKNGSSDADVKRQVAWALCALLSPLNVLPEADEHDWAVARSATSASLRNGATGGAYNGVYGNRASARSADAKTELTNTVRRFLDGYASAEIGQWVGWPFGRSLLVADLAALMLRVPGVEEVMQVGVQTARIKPGDQGQTRTSLAWTTLKDAQLALAADEVVWSFDGDATGHDIEVMS